MLSSYGFEGRFIPTKSNAKFTLTETFDLSYLAKTPYERKPLKGTTNMFPFFSHQRDLVIYLIATSVINV